MEHIYNTGCLPQSQGKEQVIQILAALMKEEWLLLHKGSVEDWAMRTELPLQQATASFGFAKPHPSIDPGFYHGVSKDSGVLLRDTEGCSSGHEQLLQL